jgi:hypothetical protein
MKFSRTLIFLSTGYLPILLVLIGGCKPKDEPPEVIPVDGRIEAITVTDTGGTITVTYFNEKQNLELTGTAAVTPQTEIMINGAAAKLSDLRTGESVRGDVQIEKKNDERLLTALKIYADRPIPNPEDKQPADEQGQEGGG